ncbi:4-carboxymuconolactone decarboxylase [uncultured Friedmanniella sp.]|uniref:bifunctional 3-oxoadipate enol-lactonase/4-carboxymuconolactone decarboxylase PcaDC n=1 Tax=uncultured Friedmanniella sp. TaxID=335381 RepID=UPI0035CAB293
MTVPRITGVQLSEVTAGPLLLLGPSLGTSVDALWSACAARLAPHFQVVGWDLPGHGRNRTVGSSFTMAELAAGVLALAETALVERGEPGGSFLYAGDSVGGAVGLQLLLDAPGRVAAAALLCTGARIGDPQTWADRAATVRASGTPAVLAGSATRWFAPGFLEREPSVGSALLTSLSDADDEGYAQVCEALAGFDVRGRLGRITAPVLTVAGAFDQVTPPASLQEIADGVPGATSVVLEGVAHLAPAEAPAALAALLLRHLLPDPYAAGLAVRRQVLGEAHVDRAVAATTAFTADFQELITRYAWGTIWTRPGLDRRSRSLITLTALVARGHHEELAMHVRAARTNGLTEDEIKELLLQTAIYCGVPDANTAFRIAQRVLTEIAAESGTREENP